MKPSNAREGTTAERNRLIAEALVDEPQATDARIAGRAGCAVGTVTEWRLAHGNPWRAAVPRVLPHRGTGRES